MTTDLNIAPKPKRRWGMILASALVAFLLFGGALALLESLEPAPSPASTAPADELPRVTIMPLEERQMERNLAVTGTLLPRDEIAIGTALQDQRIREVLVEEGDLVAKGQVLIRLETDILTTKLNDTQAQVARAVAAVAEKEAQLAEAEASFRRTEKLRQSGVANVQTYDERRAAYLAADHALKALKAELAQSEAQVAEAKLQLERAEIRAPEAGIISERAAQTGAMPGSEPLLKLIRNGDIELAAEVPEADLPLVKPGQFVAVRLTGMDQIFEGEVRLVAPKVDPRTRLGIVKVMLPKDPVIRPGIFARGTLLLERRRVEAIADTAMLYQEPGNKPYVFVVDGEERVARRFVEPGLQRDGYVEIRSGLSKQERVVRSASAFLQEGDRIQPVTETDKPK
ncbi:efflux RND transporter periplasmic adaptor subunit [Nordella sp. HKS 07]|uniref:efflux RND transporter periplasmic adaptor subunit n=1 Tax=Nordella sp. HKS 07 TaxID=2712222 RepID=UPI0013E0F16C|nr:efflux RND transporter periplasmic adaptor subunit [Nordella sp. HKS 07]QIG47704.1 efflux RND transporter periplasmic adaptor subunit [Nordella sp. HKS 07]